MLRQVQSIYSHHLLISSIALKPDVTYHHPNEVYEIERGFYFKAAIDQKHSMIRAALLKHADIYLRLCA